MEVVDPVSGERAFLVVEPHQDDIEGIDQIDPENGRDGRDLPTGDDGECRYHEGDEHRPGLPEEHVGLYIIEPTDEYGGDENRETEQYEDGIGLRKGRWVDQVEFDGQYRHHEEGDEGESRSESRDSIRPVDGIEDQNIPDDGEDERDQVDLEGSEDDIVLVQIEDSSEYIGDISYFDARDSDNRPHTDLHHEPDFGWHEERCIPPHLSELLGGFLHIAFAFAIEFMDRVEIVYEAYDGYDCAKHEDDEKPVLVDIAEERVEEEGEEEKIEIEDTPDSERYRSSLVSVGCRIIEKSEP